MNTKKFHMCYQTLIYSPNGTRRYFGKHSTNKLDDKYLGSGNYIHSAKKLGYDIQIVDRIFFDTAELAYEFEELLIYEAWDKYGKGIECMNMKPGGEGGSCTKRTFESVEKSASKIRGIPRPKEVIEKIRKTNKANGCKSEETKLKMSLAKKGVKRTAKANAAHIGKHSQPRLSKRSKLWEFETELKELWLLNNMPKRRNFQRIIVENGYPNLDTGHMVKTFEKNV